MLRLVKLLLLGTVFVANQALAQDSENLPAIKEWAEELNGYARDAMGSGETAQMERSLRRYFQLFPSDF